MRRAALHRLGWDDGADYRLDALAGPEILRDRVKGGDLRALLLALKTWREAPQEILARIVLTGPAADLAHRHQAARRLLAAGFQEAAKQVNDKGAAWAGSYLGS
jgi:hypothetical protein